MYDFYRSWNLPSNGTIVDVYSMTVTFIFKVKHFLLCICYKKVQAVDVPGRFASTRIKSFLFHRQSLKKNQNVIFVLVICFTIYLIICIHIITSHLLQLFEELQTAAYSHEFRDIHWSLEHVQCHSRDVSNADINHTVHQKCIRVMLVLYCL